MRVHNVEMRENALSGRETRRMLHRHLGRTCRRQHHGSRPRRGLAPAALTRLQLGAQHTDARTLNTPTSPRHIPAATTPFDERNGSIFEHALGSTRFIQFYTLGLQSKNQENKLLASVLRTKHTAPETKPSGRSEAARPRGIAKRKCTMHAALTVRVGAALSQTIYAYDAKHVPRWCN